MNKTTSASYCIRCQKPFVCGVASGQQSCWCMEHPAYLAVPEGAVGCFCPGCLAQEVSQRKKQREQA